MKAVTGLMPDLGRTWQRTDCGVQKQSRNNQCRWYKLRVASKTMLQSAFGKTSTLFIVAHVLSRPPVFHIIVQ